MQLNRGLLFWAFALITAGVVALAVQGGVIDREVLADAWRLWPLVLVAIGLGLLLSRTPLAPLGAVVGGALLGFVVGSLFTVGPVAGGGCGPREPTVTERFQSSLDGSPEVEVEFNCGDFAISTVDGSEWLLTAAGDADDPPRVEESDGRLELATATGGGIFGVGGTRNEWMLELPTDPTFDLDVQINAGDAQVALGGASLTGLDLEVNATDLDLDLSGAEAEAFDVGMNAASTTVRFDAQSVVDGEIEANAGSITICTPEDASVAITLGDTIAFSHDLDASDLDRRGDTWSSGDGSPDVTLRVSGNASSLDYNPPGGCDT